MWYCSEYFETLDSKQPDMDLRRSVKISFGKPRQRSKPATEKCKFLEKKESQPANLVYVQSVLVV